MSFKVKAFLFFFVGLMVIPGSSLAQFSCKDIYLDLKRPSTFSPTSAPVEFQYRSREGATRYFRDGAIWQLHNNSWIHIGYGRYFNNRIYEDNLSTLATHRTQQTQDQTLPDLTPLRQFQFGTSRFEAHRYFPNVGVQSLSIIYELHIGSHRIEVVIPKNSGFENSIRGIVNAIAELPVKRIEALKTVRLNTGDNRTDAYWQQKYKNFVRAWATGGDGEIDIYRIALRDFTHGTSEAVRITRHEFGHVIASKLFGSPDPNHQYTDRAMRDPYAVSEYGNNSWAEDFAEAVEVYLRTNAGRLNPGMRSGLVNRFTFLDDIFSYRNPQSVSRDPSQAKQMTFFSKLIGEAELLVLSPELGVGILLSLD